MQRTLVVRIGCVCVLLSARACARLCRCADQDGAVGLRDARLLGQVDAEHQEPRPGAGERGGPVHRQGGADGAHRRLLRQHHRLRLPQVRQERGQEARGARVDYHYEHMRQSSHMHRTILVLYEYTLLYTLT